MEATAVPSADASGHVLVRLDPLDLDATRDYALMILAGPLTEDPDWPPDRPSKSGASRDERQLAILAEYLGLDEVGWGQLVADAWRHAASPEFERTEHASEYLLAQGHVLDEHTLQHVYQIARKADMQHKTVSASSRVTADLGEFAAIAAAYTVDRDNEQILRGAFEQTIASWQASAKMIPLHWNHSGAAKDIIGAIDPETMRETSEGLFVTGRLDLQDSDVARQAWRSMKNDAVALSFGYLVQGDNKRSDGVRELTAIDLFEISIVPAPANPDTRLVSLKSVAEDDGPPTDAELRHHAEQLGIIEPDPEYVRIRDAARDQMLALLGSTDTPKSDDQLRAKAARLGIDLERKSNRPIKVATFEIE